MADADDPEVELVKMEKDRMRQQLNRALKRAEEADPADDADASTAASDPMDPARLEEAALAQASTYGGSEHKKAARMARLAESANPELELIRMEKSRLNGARRRVKQKAEIASARKELEELEKAGTEVEVVLPEEGEAKVEEIKEEGEGGAEEAGNFEYRGSERNKLHRMARLRASGDPEKTLRTLELNRLRCKKIRERKKALKEAAENPLGAPPEGVSAKELRHMTCPVCGKIFSSKAAARAHVQYVHMKKGQRETTVCHLCGKAASARYANQKTNFGLSFNLKNHLSFLRLHTKYKLRESSVPIGCVIPPPGCMATSRNLRIELLPNPVQKPKITARHPGV